MPVVTFLSSLRCVAQFKLLKLSFSIENNAMMYRTSNTMFLLYLFSYIYSMQITHNYDHNFLFGEIMVCCVETYWVFFGSFSFLFLYVQKLECYFSPRFHPVSFKSWQMLRYWGGGLHLLKNSQFFFLIYSGFPGSLCGSMSAYWSGVGRRNESCRHKWLFLGALNGYF